MKMNFYVCLYPGLWDHRSSTSPSSRPPAISSELIILFHRIGLQMRVWRGSFKLYNLTVYFMTDKMLSPKKCGLVCVWRLFPVLNVITFMMIFHLLPLEVMQTTKFSTIFLQKNSSSFSSTQTSKNPLSSLFKENPQKYLELKFSPLCLFQKNKKILYDEWKKNK